MLGAMRRSLIKGRAAARAGAALAFALAAFALAPAPLALAAASFESGGALGNLTEGASEEQTTTPAKAANTGSSEETTHNSSSTVAIVIAIGAVLLAGVAFVIIRDARRWAPAGDAELVEAGGSRHSPAALQRRRAKAKAARKQRKRNR